MSRSPEPQDVDTVDNMVRDHYAAQRLGTSRLDGLVALGVPEPASRRRLAFAALAASVLIAAFGLGYLERAREQRATLPVAATPAERPGLVAVQIHADWCPRSPEVVPVFTDLLTRYGNQPVLFVTMDITDDVRREQARLLADSLDVPEAFGEPFGSGMIKLIDRESHTVLAAVTGSGQAGELELRLTRALLDDRERGAGGT